jgi:hypothetical protein
MSKAITIYPGQTAEAIVISRLNKPTVNKYTPHKRQLDKLLILAFTAQNVKFVKYKDTYIPKW